MFNCFRSRLICLIVIAALLFLYSSSNTTPPSSPEPQFLDDTFIRVSGNFFGRRYLYICTVLAFFADLVYCREDWAIYSGPSFLVSWGRRIRLHPRPILPRLPSVQERRHTGRLSKRGNLLTTEGGARSQIIRSQESMVIYESFNTLWWKISDGKTTHLPGNIRRLTPQSTYI